MKIFTLISDLPYFRHDQPGVTAVHIITYQLLKNLKDQGNEVIIQTIFNEFRKEKELKESETNLISMLSKEGFTMEAPYFFDQYGHSKDQQKSLLSKLFSRPQIKEFYPAWNLRDDMRKRIQSHQADAVLTIWSPEGVAATHGLRDVPRIIYHGDVEPLVKKSRFIDHALFSPGLPHVSLKTKLGRNMELCRFKKAHYELMNDVDLIANVTNCNSQFYGQSGRARCIYVPNTWTDGGQLKVNQSEKKKKKIIGHFGYLNRTGATYGLDFLLNKLMPVLKRRLSDIDYEVHIIGGGKMSPPLAAKAEKEGVHVRGYVKDLDAELASSDVVLLLNNAGRYQAAYTRHMVSWSLGLCLIAHQDSEKAIPEIKHNENALMGRTASDISDCVYTVLTDAALNQRLRSGGRQTYERYFRPHTVSQKLNETIRQEVENAKRH